MYGRIRRFIIAYKKFLKIRFSNESDFFVLLYSNNIYMNKYFLFVLGFSFLSNAQNITFTDVNFKNALVNTICINNDANPGADIDADVNNDGEIEISEALLVTNLSINNQNISNIDEIGYFSNLQYLSCSQNSISSIEFFNNTTLQSLFCSGNLMTTIDLSSTGFVQGDFSNNINLQAVQLKNGITNSCIILLMQGIDYTCSMFLNCPSLVHVCLDQQDLDSSMFYSSSPQEFVTFNTNSNCALNSENFKNNELKIYPNPFNDYLKLSTETNLNIERITIYNSLGQIVNTNTSNYDYIDVSKLKTGYYFIEIVSDEGKKIEKIIKQ